MSSRVPLFVVVMAVAAQAQETVIAPFVLDAVRRPQEVAGQVLVDHGRPGSTLRLDAVRVRAGDGRLLYERAVDLTLVGDPRFAELSTLIERLPVAITERRLGIRHFAPPAAPTFTASEIPGARAEIARLLTELRESEAAGLRTSFSAIDFPVHFGVLFDEDDPPGTVRAVIVEVEGVDETGTPITLAASQSVVHLAPFAPLPPSSSVAGTVAPGDLHVHSCHGEAMGACAPSGNCTAETLQVSGSFSYAQLRSQYEALGISWYTATDHSYCINSTSEFDTIVAECNAVTDAAFVCFPHTELSSDEQGAQSGSDGADLLCLGGTPQNHMGAHGITSRKPGGSDGLLGFCDGLFSDVLDGFTANAAAIRAEGGFPIVNHPADDNFAWNSVSALAGVEGSQMQGVEIWNGDVVLGQGANVGAWVDWLLDGRILYGYSGSDTHDAAFAFGATHAILNPGATFGPDAILDAVRTGRCYISGGPSLVGEVDFEGRSLALGTVQTLATGQPPASLTVMAHYDFGGAGGTVTIFKGRVGDVAETVLCQDVAASGAGTLSCATPLDLVDQTYYRAYLETTTGVAAYSNPIFFVPGGSGYVSVGDGLGAPNIGTLASTSSPAIDSVSTLSVSGFTNSTTVFVVLSAGDIPGGVPFKGGTLFVNVPFLVVLPLPLAGGATAITFQLPEDEGLIGGQLFWQLIAPDGTQPGGFALSNMLEMTITGIGG